MWSDDTEDASGASTQQSKNTYDPIADSYPQPHLVLNHSPLDGSESQNTA